MKSVQLMIKSIAGVFAVAVAYVDQTLTPLFWALIVLVTIDVLLNAHKEGQQFTKIGSAFATLAGTLGLSGHIAQPDFLRVLVAVATLAYVQVVVPQLLVFLGKIKWSKNAAANTAISAEEAAVIQGVVAKLQAQADATAGVPNNADGTKL